MRRAAGAGPGRLDLAPPAWHADEVRRRSRNRLLAVSATLLAAWVLGKAPAGRQWSAWLGVKYSVFVNSGASANLLTMTALRETFGPGEVIVPTLTWVSDIASVIQCSFKPVFVDINPRTLGIDDQQVISRLTPQTRAVFLTHVLGYNALTQRLLDELKARNIPLIEDVCESHGATFNERKLGTFGLMSNFSFYYAHHMTTIEGGMISTDNPDLYETLRMLRSHGMVRESDSAQLKRGYCDKFPDLNPDFIFAFSAYNVRSTEINAVLGRSQLKRLDQMNQDSAEASVLRTYMEWLIELPWSKLSDNERRRANLRLFLDNIDPEIYRTDFEVAGSCNYAFTLILKRPDSAFRDKLEQRLRAAKVEFRRGTSGGGNQLRQPYVRKLLGDHAFENYPEVDHVHFYGYYIGNYPELERGKILALCAMLNQLR